MADSTALGQRLAQQRREKAAREQRDLLQKDVAKAIGTSAVNVSRWESGQVVPGEEMIAKLAKYFGVSRSWLRYGEGEKHPSPIQPDVETTVSQPAKAKRRRA